MSRFVEVLKKLTVYGVVTELNFLLLSISFQGIQKFRVEIEHSFLKLKRNSNSTPESCPDCNVTLEISAY